MIGITLLDGIKKTKTFQHKGEVPELIRYNGKLYIRSHLDYGGHWYFNRVKKVYTLRSE
jgi:hypothetical protein